MKGIIKRIGEIIIVGVFMFIALAVMHKLFRHNEEWLYASLVWTISWMVASIIVKLFGELNIDSIKLSIFNIGIIAFIFIILAFLLGVVLDVLEWEKIVADIIVPFGMAIFVNSKTNSKKK